MKILVIGGNRFFGKLVVNKLVNSGHEVTVLNRGNLTFDSLLEKHIKCDRRDSFQLEVLTKGHFWDVIIDQVCMNSSDAKISQNILFSKTNRYIMTSSQSVYPFEANLQEDKFDPYHYQFPSSSSQQLDYAEAKRQAEATLVKNKQLSIAIIRPPIVLGLHDYTERLLFHIKRIKQGKPLYFPNINASISFVHEEDLAENIILLMSSSIEGPINFASFSPILLGNIISSIEEVVGKKVLLKSSEDENKEANSPFGIPSDWYMCCDLAQRNNFKFKNIDNWLPQLIQNLNV